MKQVSLILILLLFQTLCFEISAQGGLYVSKPSGGSWNNPDTWEGGVVPPSGSNVLVTGPVTVQGSVTCRKLSLSPDGSLANLTGTCAGVTITDTLFNEGLITTNVPDYYCYGERLTIDIRGDIIRPGRFRPTRLYISEAKTHAFYNPGNDTIWSWVQFRDSSTLLCHDPVIFGNRVINAFIDLNRNDLVTVAGCSMEYSATDKPYRSEIVNARTIYAEKGSLIGNNETQNFLIYGDSIFLHGYVTTAGISFYGNVFNFDTLANYGEKWKYIQGDFVNTGAIINNTGWHVSHSIQVTGNILNTGSWYTAWLVLSGKKTRNIQLNSGVSDAVYFTDTMTLSGYNTLPALIPYPWSNPSPTCTIDKNATLVISNPQINSAVISYGRIRSSNSDNATWYELPLPHASVLRKTGSPINSIQADSYSRQYHPFIRSGLKHWWVFTNNPRNYTNMLEHAYFAYTDDEAENLDEAQIKAFYSVDGGLTWKWCSSYQVNTHDNWIRVNNIPSAAQFVFAVERIDSLLSPSLGVSSVNPKKIGTGSNNPSFLSIEGKGFTNATKVLFRNKERTFTPDTVFLTGLHGSSIKAVLRPPKTGKTEYYDLVVFNPDQPEIIVPSAIEVNPYSYAIPWFVLGGRDRTLANRWQTFEFSYGNTGLADAWGVPVFFAVKDQQNMEVAFPDVTPELPSYAYELNHAFLRDSSLYFMVDSLFEEPGPWRIYGFYIPNIPARTSEVSRIKIKAPDDIDLQAWIINPYQPDISFVGVGSYKDGTSLNACLTAFAMKSFAMNIVGQLPGIGCVSSLADKYFDPVGYVTGTNQNEDNGWGSILWSASSWALAIGNCAADIVPVAKAVKIAAGIASFVADIKENYDADQKCRNKYDRKRLRTRTVFSVDPNEKIGNPGSGDAHFVNNSEMNYTIFFENKSSATASALEVFISDTLDPALFDLSRLRFTRFAFGNTNVSISEDTLSVTRVLDLAPEKDILLSFHAETDTITGIVHWSFRSLDRITGELTEDPDAGFLPPNVSSPEGEGSVSFTVPLRNNLPDNTVIRNKACIVFDLNEPIVTNTFTNIVDNTPPVSSINASYSENDAQILIAVDGTDAASGIASFSITVSHNDEEPFPWTTFYSLREGIFTPPENGTWKFFSRSTDFAGNKESADNLPMAQVVVNNLRAPSLPSGGIEIFPNPAYTSISITLHTMEPVHYEIISSEGNCMKKGYLRQAKEEIDISSLPAGVYIVKVIRNNSVTTRRIVVL